jgi:adenine-specific DNA-methyltransferase
MNKESKTEPFGSLLLEGDAATILEALPPDSYDLVITSPPYNIGKEYELKEFASLDSYLEKMDSIVELLVEKLSENGSLCWQVGNFVQNGVVVPLDILTYKMFSGRGMKLRNRIIWRFNFGLHATNRFSGRYVYKNSNRLTVAARVGI